MEKEIKLAGFNLTRISGEKKPHFKGNLEIKTHINVKNVERFKPDSSKQDILRIDFEFLISYGDLGRLNLEGSMYLVVDAKTLKEVFNSWKNKKLPENIDMLVLNLVVQKASIKAFQLEEELGLPVHIQLPRLQKSKQ